jgi:hypothetical protein
VKGDQWVFLPLRVRAVLIVFGNAEFHPNRSFWWTERFPLIVEALNALKATLGSRHLY